MSVHAGCIGSGLSFVKEKGMTSPSLDFSKKHFLYSVLPGITLIAFAAAHPAVAAEEKATADPKKAVTSAAKDHALIRSAMLAAPKKVAEAAAVIMATPDGKMRTLREGTNGFTCMPDNPATPGPDPMCMDKAALDWATAWMTHQTPAAGKIGFLYMLAGGTDASNTDPYAVKPGATNHWVKTGPHVMIVGAEQRFYDMYPKVADPDTASPYVMWAGTPYQHLMIPVR
jgi:hypothetical protein